MQIMRKRGIMTKSISIVMVMVTGFVMLFGGIGAQPAFAASKPGVPTFLVEKYGSTEIKVTIKKLKGANGYRIYRAKSKTGKYKSVKILAKTKGTYIDKGLKASTKYYYKVKAYKKVSGKKKYGKFSAVKWAKTKAAPNGNASKYDVKNIKYQASDLKDKRAYFLGSSVTKGMYTKSDGSGDVSFVEMLEKKYGMEVRKSAVNGTTLVTPTANNYIARLQRELGSLDAPDYFVCQLSTNDATKASPLGSIKAGKFSKADFDTETVAGAIEYITWYVQRKWNCPVIFYVPTKPKSTWTYQSRYLKMIDILYKAQLKWNDSYEDQIQIIDLWNDPKAKYKSTDDRLLCMFNTLHPTKAGYLLKYVPIIGDFLLTKYKARVIQSLLDEPLVTDETIVDEPVLDEPADGSPVDTLTDDTSTDGTLPEGAAPDEAAPYGTLPAVTP